MKPLLTIFFVILKTNLRQFSCVCTVIENNFQSMLWIQQFGNVMTTFIINNRTDA